MKPHDLFLTFKEDMVNIIDGHCSCEAGNSQSCNHLVGLAHFLQDLIFRGCTEIPDDVSCTSIPMQWNKPREKHINPEMIMTTVFADPTNIDRKKPPVMSTYKVPFTNQQLDNVQSEDCKKLLDCLRACGNDISLTYLLGEVKENVPMVLVLNGTTTAPHNTVLGLQNKKILSTTEVAPQAIKVDNPLPIKLPHLDSEMINILLSCPPVAHSNLNDVNFVLSEEIEKKTRGQANSDLWHKQRRLRQMFISTRDISYVKSIQHGRENESVAIQLYLSQFRNVEFYKCGLLIHPYANHLGASPDGVLYKKDIKEYGLLEVKCPCGKNSDSLLNYAKQKNSCLTEELNFKKTHHYYHQVQGQMLVSGLRWCEFVIYIDKSKELFHMTVPFDADFCREMYKKLTSVYKEQIVPIIID